MQDLVDRTGVHRGSLYDTFGDKNQLFLNCLDRFQAVTKNRAFGSLKRMEKLRNCYNVISIV
ncbi:TetR/AcrR family transcriptional regulator [Paenibacillus barengoltzii]|uniref:TetR/AcrR family transcriptional regulator n=1 Tax=Paenibacillus TaxID=44249 RepID=UPI003CC6002A